jgi:nucleoside-diphosphate-sugar epimerase
MTEFNKKPNVTILGCGWLGKALAIYLIQNNYTVFGSTTQEVNIESLRKVGVKPFIYSTEKFCLSEKYLTENLVIAFPPGKNRDYSNYENQIQQILNQLNNKVERIILISSTTVYPKHSGNWSENSEYKAETPQAAFILKAEKLILKCSIKHKIVLRFAGLIDENRNPLNWIKDQKTQLPPDEPVNLIHKVDCIKIIEVLIHSNFKSEVFNACSDVHPTREEFYKAVSRNNELEFGTISGIRRTIDNSKLKKMLNYNYTFPNPITFFAS